MKTPAVLVLIGLLSGVPLSASFESVRVDVTVEPQLPARLRMEGLREGRVTIVVDVDAEGQLKDWLVTAASHADLIRPCIEALQQWRFTPARYNGARVPARQEISLTLSQTGAVISRTVMETVDDFFERVAGRRFDYQMCRASEIDHPLVATHRVTPQYATEAERQGVGGRVRVHFYVDEQGKVRLPAVPADTPSYLAAVAVEAMRGWTFEPPTRAGQPVLVAAVQEFDFGGASR